MPHALTLNPENFPSECPIAASSAIDIDFSNFQALNTNSRLASYFSKILANRKDLNTANGDAIEIRDGTVVLNIFAGSQKIATRTLGTITDILGAGSNLRITYIDPSSRFIRFFPWLCLLLTLLMLASFRPVGPPQIPLSPLRGPLPILVRGKFKLAPILGMIFRLALEGRDRSLRSKGRERVIRPLITLWHHYTNAMSEALQSFPHNAWQKSLPLGLIAALFFTSIPMPAFAAAAETDFFYYHHGDHLGSTNVITEGNTSAIHSGITYAKGDIVQRFEYSPYGQESYVLNPSLDLEVSYTGQNYDVESGLYFYNSRYYNSQLGRFIQPDTMIPDPTNLQAYNRYSYVHNNPLNYTDPSGHNEYGGESPSIPTSGYNPSGGGQSASGVGGVLNFILNTSIASMAMRSMEDSIPSCDSDTTGNCVNSDGSAVLDTIIVHGSRIKPIPVAADGMPNQGFGEVFGVVDYSLDVADAIPVAGDVAEGNLSTLYVPEGVDASDYGILVSMYTHFQNGNKTDLNINASTLDFSGTSQSQLGLANMTVGQNRPVNLFKSGINQNSLAFGKVKMTYEGNSQFSILPDRFDFDIEKTNRFSARNIGTALGAFANYAINPMQPILFGGSYNVIFNNTATIPK
jgi:RHS repeat-associated protein